MLKLLQFKVLSLCSWHNANEREHLIGQFNDESFECDVLLVQYSMGSYGLNLQKLCSRMILAEYPYSMEIFTQAGGRIVRIGATNTSVILILHLLNSHDDNLRANLYKKMIPKIIAEGDFNTEDPEEIRGEAMKMAQDILGMNGITVPMGAEDFEEFHQENQAARFNQVELSGDEGSGSGSEIGDGDETGASKVGREGSFSPLLSILADS